MKTSDICPHFTHLGHSTISTYLRQYRKRKAVFGTLTGYGTPSARLSGHHSQSQPSSGEPIKSDSDDDDGLNDDVSMLLQSVEAAMNSDPNAATAVRHAATAFTGSQPATPTTVSIPVPSHSDHAIAVTAAAAIAASAVRTPRNPVHPALTPNGPSTSDASSSSSANPPAVALQVRNVSDYNFLNTQI